jgi:hypothetical protein
MSGRHMIKLNWYCGNFPSLLVSTPSQGYKLEEIPDIEALNTVPIT